MVFHSSGWGGSGGDRNQAIVIAKGQIDRSSCQAAMSEGVMGTPQN